MDEFIECMKEKKINVNCKYKGKRWGSINKSDDGEWSVRICVQYDEYLAPVLLNESVAM